MEKNLIDIIAKSGIVGAGGAGFPTHVKMNAKAEYVIINGAECEPLLRVDQQLMAVETKKILDALKLCMEAVGADKGVIALKGHYEAAINSFNQLLGEYEGISLHLLPNFYPAGDEQITVYEVTGRIVPEGSKEPHYFKITTWYDSKRSIRPRWRSYRKRTICRN